jgi:hypothetical protein
MIKNTFYTGISNSDGFRYGRVIKSFKINSEIKDHSHLYILWFEFITKDNKVIETEKFQVDASTLCDVKGYVQKEFVESTFSKIFEQQLTQKLNNIRY